MALTSLRMLKAQLASWLLRTPITLTPNVVSYNGDDAVVLLDPNNDTLDIIGIVGVDPW